MHTGRYVVMGVCGCGKTRIGSALAEALGLEFVEGDAFHPTSNLARMKAGVALTDDERHPWLAALAERLRQARDAGQGLVMSCSALKQHYRDHLRAGAPDLQLVFLTGDRATLAARLAARGNHFMPATMLDGQLAILERPVPDEHAWVCDIGAEPEAIVAALVARADGSPGAPSQTLGPQR